MPRRRSHLHFVVGWALAACSIALWACGTADHASVPEPVADGGDQAQVSSGVNVCPLFSGSLVMPQRIGPGEASTISVRATDPDAPDSLLIFAWSAPSGTFSAPDKPVTTYRCDEPGNEQLTATVRDTRGCTATLLVAIECVSN